MKYYLDSLSRKLPVDSAISARGDLSVTQATQCVYFVATGLLRDYLRYFLIVSGSSNLLLEESTYISGATAMREVKGVGNQV